MRKLALAFLFCLISSIANAETFQLQKVMICDKKEIVFEKLALEFEEAPIWSGADVSDSSRYVLTINNKTGAWTLVQYDRDIACVLGAGTNSKVTIGKTI